MKSFLISCVGAYDDSGIGTGGFVMYNHNNIVTIDKLDTTGLFNFKSNYFRFIRATKLLVGYNSKGVFYQCNFPDVKDCHDIFLKDELVIFVSTNNNQILYYNYLGELIKKDQFIGSGDAWHLNCLTEKNNQLFLTAFGEFTEHREWNSKGCFEKGILLNLESKEVIINKLSGPHTPRYIDNKWMVCNSHTNSLRIYSDKIKYIDIPLGGFTRGFCHDEDYLYVGVSADRKSENPTTSKIVVLSRKDYSIVKTIDIPFPEIYDILICNEKLVKNLKKDISKFQLISDSEVTNSLIKQIEIGHKSNIEYQKKIESLNNSKNPNIVRRIIKKLF